MTNPDEITGFDQLPEDPEDVPASIYSKHEFEYPDYSSHRPSRFGKYVRIFGLVATIAIICAIGVYLIDNNNKDDDFATSTYPTPTTTPTRTPAPPTNTPEPTTTPYPTTTPISVHGDAFAPPLPTQDPRAANGDPSGVETPTEKPPFVFTPYQRSLVFAFASCNGLYEGDAQTARANAARDTIASRTSSTDQILNIAINNCHYTAETLPTPGPALPIPTPLPTSPPTVATLPTPTPPPTTLLMELRNARWLAHNRPNFIDQLGHIPWILGPMNPDQALTAQQLLFIAVEDPALLTKVIVMPFLQQPDALDYQALRSLRILRQQGPQRINVVLSHPIVVAGITDAWTPVIATLHQTEHPELYLNSAHVSVETRTAVTPYGTKLHIHVVRSADGASHTMDSLQEAIVNTEAYMTVPMPTSSVILLVDDHLPQNVPGINLGTHIGIASKYDDPNNPEAIAQAPFMLAHEVAHYYWNDNHTWFDEGISNIVAYATEATRTGSNARFVSPPCPEAANISQLENLQAHNIPISRNCVYSLGERLFLDLQQVHQHPQFRQRLQKLYSLTADSDDILGIEHIRQVMGDNDQARALINYWYLGEKMDRSAHHTSRIDISPPNPAIPQINGYVQNAYLSLEYQGKPVIQFSATQHQNSAYVNVHYSYSIVGDPKTAELEIIEYYQDGFATRSTPHTIIAESHHSGGAFWIPVGPGDETPWRPGSYWTMVYHQGHKIAQVQWNITP